MNYIALLSQMRVIFFSYKLFGIFGAISYQFISFPVLRTGFCKLWVFHKYSQLNGDIAKEKRDSSKGNESYGLRQGRASSMAQWVKNPPAMKETQETCVGSLGLRSSGEGNGNPLQYSCLENPMDREAWWTIVHGVTKSLKWKM